MRHSPRLLVAIVVLSSRSLSADPRYTVVDEPVYLYIDNDKHGNTRCTIDIHLWVSGPKRDNCIKKLEQAAHIARFESWTTTQRRTP